MIQKIKNFLFHMLSLLVRLVFSVVRKIPLEPREYDVDISFLCMTWNRLEFFKKTISELLTKHSGKSTFEIIIWNNASTDGTVEFLKQYENHPNIRIINSPKNISLNATRKLYSRKLNHGRVLIKVDDDVLEIPQDYDLTVLKYVDTCTDYGFFSADVVQNEFTNGAKSSPETYAEDLRYPECPLQEGCAGGWFSICRAEDYRRFHLLFEFRKKSFAAVEDAFINAVTQLCLKKKTGIITKLKVFHASGPYYARKSGTLERELLKYSEDTSHIKTLNADFRRELDDLLLEKYHLEIPKLEQLEIKETPLAEKITIVAYAIEKDFTSLKYSILKTRRILGNLPIVIIAKHATCEIENFAKIQNCRLQIDANLKSKSLDGITNLHKYFDTPYCLIISENGYPLHDGIEPFISAKLDYIGARTKPGKTGLASIFSTQTVLNGDFSLRSKKACRAASESWRFWGKFFNGNSEFFDDGFFYSRVIRFNPINRIKLKFPNNEQISEFCVDMLSGKVAEYPTKTPFGVHGEQAASHYFAEE